MVSVQERSEVVHDLSFSDSKVVIQEIQQLLLHQVNFGLTKHLGISTPMLILGGRIVEVFSGDDECSKEDSVSGTWHSLGYFGKTVSEPFEVDECGKEG